MIAAPQTVRSSDRARALYDELFDAEFTERNQGKLLLLDLDTRKHWLVNNERELANLTETLPHPPGTHRFLLRVGFEAAHTLSIAW